ncbi:MAG: monofunctional biosynthetic peptidoglycan transglycosylase [Pseudomonadota bacterium]
MATTQHPAHENGGAHAVPTRERAAAPKRRGFLQRKGVRLSFALLATVFAFHVLLTGLYRFVNPAASNWMRLDAISGVAVAQTWVPIEAMSPAVIKAVIASEDARFCAHWGVDWREVYYAVANADSRGPRGASTITMQTAKNLYLWPGRSYVRKAIELPLTWMIETLWPKRRILEVYLNVAEWGPGIYGIESAAQHHFGRSARRLDGRQAAILVATLPNPIRRVASKPGRTTLRQARRVRQRMRAVDAGCVLAG